MIDILSWARDTICSLRWLSFDHELHTIMITDDYGKLIRRHVRETAFNELKIKQANHY